MQLEIRFGLGGMSRSLFRAHQPGTTPLLYGLTPWYGLNNVLVRLAVPGAYPEKPYNVAAV